MWPLLRGNNVLSVASRCEELKTKTPKQTPTISQYNISTTPWVLYAKMAMPILQKPYAPRYCVHPLRRQSNTGHLIACSLVYLRILPSPQYAKQW